MLLPEKVVPFLATLAWSQEAKLLPVSTIITVNIYVHIKLAVRCYIAADINRIIPNTS